MKKNKLDFELFIRISTMQCGIMEVNSGLVRNRDMSRFIRYTDSAVEQFYLKEDVANTKTGIVVAICFCLLFVINDYVFLGTGLLFYQTVLVRLIFTALSVGCLFFLRRIKSYQQHERLVYGWSVLLVLLLAYVNLTRQADNINFTYLDPLIVLLILIYFPGAVGKKAVLAGCQVIIDLAIAAFLRNSPYTLSWEVITCAYVLSFILGLVIAVKLCAFRHEHYYALVKEQNLRLELEKSAYTDCLTGAFNRRKFFQLGEELFNRFQENQEVFALIMLDLDFFKNLNDKFGHAAGDAFLLSFSKLILQHTRAGDIMGRLGGEEFALILPVTCLDFANEVAEKIRYSCEQNKAFFNKRMLQTTVSIGVTEVCDKDRSFAEALNRADEALYQAKRWGRNQVHLSEA